MELSSVLLPSRKSFLTWSFGKANIYVYVLQLETQLQMEEIWLFLRKVIVNVSIITYAID